MCKISDSSISSSTGVEVIGKWGFPSVGFLLDFGWIFFIAAGHGPRTATISPYNWMFNQTTGWFSTTEKTNENRTRMKQIVVFLLTALLATAFGMGKEWHLENIPVNISIRSIDIVVLSWRLRLRRMLMQCTCLSVIQNIHRTQCYRSLFCWEYIISFNGTTWIANVYELSHWQFVFVIVSVEGPWMASGDIEPSRNTAKHKTVHTYWDALYIFNIHIYFRGYL